MRVIFWLFWGLIILAVLAQCNGPDQEDVPNKALSREQSMRNMAGKPDWTHRVDTIHDARRPTDYERTAP